MNYSEGSANSHDRFLESNEGRPSGPETSIFWVIFRHRFLEGFFRLKRLLMEGLLLTSI